jgi:hypothetical protein
LTAKRGTGKPHADQTGEPTKPGRTQTCQPSAATDRAKTEASANEENGTNKQAGAGDQPEPEGKARRAHTQPQDRGRATTPAPREPKTDTKPAINTPKSQETNRTTTPPARTTTEKKKREKRKRLLKQAENFKNQCGERLERLIERKRD